MNNKKGGIAISIIILLVVVVLIFLFFAFWGYGINQLMSSIRGANIDNEIVNLTYASENTLGYYNQSMNNLELIGVMILFGFMISTFIIGYYSRVHPMMFFVYLLIMIVVTIFSFYIANAYESLQGTEIGSIISNYSIGSFIILNLPKFIIGIGFIGIIINLISLVGIIGGRELG